MATDLPIREAMEKKQYPPTPIPVSQTQASLAIFTAYLQISTNMPCS